MLDELLTQQLFIDYNLQIIEIISMALISICLSWITYVSCHPLVCIPEDKFIHAITVQVQREK